MYSLHIATTLLEIQRRDLAVLRRREPLQNTLPSVQVKLVRPGFDALVDEGAQEFVRVVVVDADACLDGELG